MLWYVNYILIFKKLLTKSNKPCPSKKRSQDLGLSFSLSPRKPGTEQVQNWDQERKNFIAGFCSNLFVLPPRDTQLISCVIISKRKKKKSDVFIKTYHFDDIKLNCQRKAQPDCNKSAAPAWHIMVNLTNMCVTCLSSTWVKISTFFFLPWPRAA